MLDAALAHGLADAEAGRVRPADDVFSDLEARYRKKGGRFTCMKLALTKEADGDTPFHR